MDSVNEKSMRFFILGVLLKWFGVNFQYFDIFKLKSTCAWVLVFGYFIYLFIICVCDGKNDGDALLILSFLADASYQIYF
jgi:hypothetical protein